MTESRSSPIHQLKCAEATFLIEHACLRYLKWGDHELIRRIYPAVRDENWMTVPYKIISEELTQSASGFVARFHLHFHSVTVDFSGLVTIKTEEDQLSYTFSGTANREFLSNRTGICLLQPVSSCAGRKVSVTHPDGTTSESRFPKKILPHQPFIDISVLEWTTEENVTIRAAFTGDIFETEDQRNWSDMSFKTYSTPLSVPIPHTLKKGDHIEQSVSLTIVFPKHPKPLYENILHILSSAKKFPAIGFSQPDESVIISDKERSLLKDLIFDHYRVDIDAEVPSREVLLRKLTDARKLNIPVELVIHAPWPTAGLKELIREIKGSGILVEKVLLLQKNTKITGPDLWKEALPLLQEAFPAALYGAGTHVHFTEINRHKPLYEKMAYVAFPNNPQVHAYDDRTIIENLAAQQEIISMAEFLYPGRKIHVSPVSLRYLQDPDREHTGRYVQESGYPWTVDDRQWTHFFASWLLMSLKYFAGADQLTYCDTAGLQGLLAGNPQQEGHKGYPLKHSIYPVWDALAEISAFCPDEILNSYSAHPLVYDGYCLKNKDGHYLFVLVNFSAEQMNLHLNTGSIELSHTEIKILKEGTLRRLSGVPANSPGKSYTSFKLTGEKLELEPRSITFIRQN